MPPKKHRSRLKPRKIPAQTRAIGTVEAILEAAARILETHGIQGYTTNAVAERAGVSIGSLYQYFPNKDALTAALIDRETALLLIDIDMARRSTTFVAGLRSLVRAAIAHQMRRPALARLLDFEERRLPLAQRDAHVAGTICMLVRELLVLADAPRVVDAAIAALDMLAIVRGMVDAAGERSETNQQELEKRVLRATLGYLN
jgi:AcrR family transcriptional regulator